MGRLMQDFTKIHLNKLYDYFIQNKKNQFEDICCNKCAFFKVLFIFFINRLTEQARSFKFSQESLTNVWYLTCLLKAFFFFLIDKLRGQRKSLLLSKCTKKYKQNLFLTRRMSLFVRMGVIHIPKRKIGKIEQFNKCMASNMSFRGLFLLID